MDKWVEDFQKKNGRQPTPAEIQARAAKQGSAPRSGFKMKRFLLLLIGITVTTFVVLLIAVGTTNRINKANHNSLRDKFNEAVEKEDVNALLALFPKKQTESRFAKDGAKSLIKSGISFDKIEDATSDTGISLTESRHFLFFKSYSLNASTTTIAKGDAPKDGKLTIGNRELNDKDFKTAFFPGTYEIKLEVKNKFGKTKFKTKLQAGKEKTVGLAFNTEDSYITLPAGPNTITVSYNEKKTDIKLSDERQKIGPFAGVEDSKTQDRFSFDGDYGGVKIKNARLGDMEAGRYKFRLEGKDMLPFQDNSVSYDKKKFDPYVTALAGDWFKALQQGSTDGLATLDELIEGTQVTKVFEDDSTYKYTYKGVKISEFGGYTVFVGRDKNLYVLAIFDMVYTETKNGEKNTNAFTSTEPAEFIFRLEKDGSMKAIAKYTGINNGY